MSRGQSSPRVTARVAKHPASPPVGARDWMHRVRQVHFVGVGGVGMGGIAEVLQNLGYTVTGSDLREGRMTRHLREIGVRVHIGHAAQNVGQSDVVVVSAAVQPDNVEVVRARKQRIPVVPRAEMLAELMRFRHGIAVAGTHGKTTTTSLVASLLAEGGLDPTFVIGGQLASGQGNARLGAGRYLVAEADESDASFLYLQPMIAVVTNIDADHMDTYDGDFDRLRSTFIEFLHHLPFYGLAVLCKDDPVIAGIFNDVTRPILTYGIDGDADYVAFNIEQAQTRTRFCIRRPDATTLDVVLNLPGRHNVLNALAATIVAHEIGVDDATIIQAFAEFGGIARRFQVFGDVQIPDGRVLLIDDYGHHPSEIAATFEAARSSWPERRLVVAYQPHRYSRTRDLMDDFAEVLSRADALIVTEVYAAGEKAISGADGRALCRAIRARAKVAPVFVESLTELGAALAPVLEDGDVLLTMGAGDISSVAPTLLKHGVSQTGEGSS